MFEPLATWHFKDLQSSCKLRAVDHSLQLRLSFTILYPSFDFSNRIIFFAHGDFGSCNMSSDGGSHQRCRRIPVLVTFLRPGKHWAAGIASEEVAIHGGEIFSAFVPPKTMEPKINGFCFRSKAWTCCFFLCRGCKVATCATEQPFSCAKEALLPKTGSGWAGLSEGCWARVILGVENLNKAPLLPPKRAHLQVGHSNSEESYIHVYTVPQINIDPAK